MLEMTEAVLRDFHNWIYWHYRSEVTAIQVCIIMLQWGIARMADDAFFLTCWIQMFNGMLWVQLRVNL